MWTYDKKLQFPVKIKTPNANYARIIISQLGGPDGELAASMRYLNQRYTMPYGEIIGILTDVGTEALFCALKCLPHRQSAAGVNYIQFNRLIRSSQISGYLPTA